MGDAIKQFLNHSRLKGYMQAMQIEEVWETIMGKTVAKYTEKIHIYGSTLYIKTYVAPLKNELVYQTEMIIQRVNEALGENIVKDVKVS